MVQKFVIKSNYDGQNMNSMYYKCVSDCVSRRKRENKHLLFSIRSVLFVRVQLISSGVSASIFSHSSAHSVIPAWFNDYRPISLTSVVMTCFERLIISSSLPGSLDSPLFAYHPSRSSNDAVSRVLHPLTPGHQKAELCSLITVQHLVLKFPTDCSPSSGTWGRAPHSLPESRASWLTDHGWWRLGPLLCSLYTYDCIATRGSNTIVKCMDAMVVVGLISIISKTAYLDEMEVLLSLSWPSPKEMTKQERRSA